MCARYRQMYPPLADILVPGLGFRDFVRSAFETGIFVSADGGTGKIVEERLSRHRISEEAFEHQLGDGRWVRVAKSRTGAGNIVGIVTDLTDRKLSEDMIRRLALEDSLTGLANRNWFQEQLGGALKRSARSGKPVGVIMLDLDRFKAVNDLIGHPGGDKVLQAVANRLKASVRQTDTVARLGGDEFAIVATESDSAEDIANLGARLVEEISRPYDIDETDIHIGTSIGITVYPHDQGSAEELL